MVMIMMVVVVVMMMMVQHVTLWALSTVTLNFRTRSMRSSQFTMLSLISQYLGPTSRGGLSLWQLLMCSKQAKHKRVILLLQGDVEFRPKQWLGSMTCNYSVWALAKNIKRPNVLCSYVLLHLLNNYMILCTFWLVRLPWPCYMRVYFNDDVCITSQPFSH